MPASCSKSAIEEREAAFRAEHDAKGEPFLGRRGVLEQSRHDRPQTRAPRFGNSPRVACRNRWRRIERLRSNGQWHADYREALAGWCAGARDVVFPVGTYKMRVIHGVRCAEAPD